jgi:hypothetical protein
MRTIDQLEIDARAPGRLRTWFLGMFAGVALVLSAVEEANAPLRRQ